MVSSSPHGIPIPMVFFFFFFFFFGGGGVEGEGISHATYFQRLPIQDHPRRARKETRDLQRLSKLPAEEDPAQLQTASGGVQWCLFSVNVGKKTLPALEPSGLTSAGELEPDPWYVSAQLSLLKVTVCASWTDPCSEVQRTQKSRFGRGRRTVSRMLGLLEHNQHARELISDERRHASTTTKTWHACRYRYINSTRV